MSKAYRIMSITGKREVEQFDSNIQVVTTRLKQNFSYRALGWENELAYQVSSQQHVLPLPDLSLCSNLYLKFKLAKVLSVQLGADVHYHTSYYAPYYQPATQQFQIQDDVKIGNYPLINGYANFHLKQARFFIMAYNFRQQVRQTQLFLIGTLSIESDDAEDGRCCPFQQLIRFV